MGLTNFFGGISSFGVPVLPGSPDVMTGSVFFVCNRSGANGSDGNPGTRVDQPFATLAQALASCVASRGDVIYLLPGHVETVIAAAGVSASVAGVSIIGVGVGRNRPTINYTTAVGASFDITGANVRVKNLVFTPTGIDNVTAAVNVTGADAVIEDCDFQLATASAQAALGILTTAAGTRLTVQRCRFYGTTDAGTAAALQIVGGDGHRILYNIFSGAYTASLGAINNATTACTNTLVIGNEINNLTASSTKAMVFVSTSTGQISENKMQILSGTAPITGAAMSWVGANYYAATIATAGTLI